MMSTATTTIKVEPTDAVDLEARIQALCNENPEGISDAVLQRDMPLCDATQRVMAINRLLSTGKLELLKSGNQLVYKLKDAGKVKGSDQQERLVYQIIQDAGNKGIWSRDIRFKSNLLLTQINKILKNLESKKLIKAVKSVSASKKKVYMLFNLEPDRSVTGGAWYSQDQDFESEFVEVLNQQCFKFLSQKAEVAKESQGDPIAVRNASFSSSLDICKFISDLGISKVSLSTEDIEMILDTLIYDGKVEKTIVAGSGDGNDQVKLYRAVASLAGTTALMKIPCGVCPVYNECHVGGIISPQNCLYMKEWLDS